MAAAMILGPAAALTGAAEPLLSAPDLSAPATAPIPAPVPAPLPAPAPAPPVPVASVPGPARTGAVDCWLLDQSRLETATDHGLCADAFARGPETAALPEAPALPVPAVTPPRKPTPTEQRVRRSGRSGTTATRSSPARAGNGDFASNFRHDFNALTTLLGSGSAPRRVDSVIVPGSHNSHGP
ncbi:hypothetical protein TSO352_18745 [Azospirillum sp. TSO35-2]|nr:hypothetical protein TSO352_18745 [Azospirillum sp. TSO35-2]